MEPIPMYFEVTDERGSVTKTEVDEETYANLLEGARKTHLEEFGAKPFFQGSDTRGNPFVLGLRGLLAITLKYVNPRWAPAKPADNVIMRLVHAQGGTIDIHVSQNEYRAVLATHNGAAYKDKVLHSGKDANGNNYRVSLGSNVRSITLVHAKSSDEYC